MLPAPAAFPWRSCRATGVTMRASPNCRPWRRTCLPASTAISRLAAPPICAARSTSPRISAGLAPDHALPPEPVPPHGVHALDIAESRAARSRCIVFYRALSAWPATSRRSRRWPRALDAQGLNVRALYVGSLKDRATGAFVAQTLRDWRPRIVLNATAFSARLDDAPLAAGSRRRSRVAGRLRRHEPRSLGGVAARPVAKPTSPCRWCCRSSTAGCSPPRFPSRRKQATRRRSRICPRRAPPDPDGIAAAAERAAGWARLAATPRPERRLALVLSDYPGAAAARRRTPSASTPSPARAARFCAARCTRISMSATACRPERDSSPRYARRRRTTS